MKWIIAERRERCGGVIEMMVIKIDNHSGGGDGDDSSDDYDHDGNLNCDKAANFQTKTSKYRQR